MNCREALEKFYEFLDFELDEEKSKELKQHLEFCSDCLQRYELEEEFQKLVKEKTSSEKVDTTALQAKIKSKIDKIDSGGSRNILYLLVPIAAAVILTFTILPRISNNSQSPEDAVLAVVSPLADAHHKCLNHLVKHEIESSDPNVIDSCMSLLVDLPKNYKDVISNDVFINSAAFTDMPLGKEVHLEYQAYGKGISLFIVQKNDLDKKPFRKVISGDRTMYVGSCTLYQYVLWQDGSATYVAVSTIPEENLLQFASLF